MKNPGFSNAFEVRRRLIIGSVAVVLTFFASALPPVPASAVELGVTPSNVFGMWTNINAALKKVARIKDPTGGLLRRIDALSPRRFTDKEPADVLDRTKIFRDKLARLFQKAGIGKHEVLKARRQTKVTPSDVFLESGHVLDIIVGFIIHKTNKRVLVSPFYKYHNFSGKVPSNVYALVDLADRRIELILEK